MNKDMTSLLESIRIFFWRYHLTIFIVIAVSGVSLAMWSLIAVVQKSGDTAGYAAETTSFDQTTIERVRNLDDVPDYTFGLPANQRNNPFAE